VLEEVRAWQSRPLDPVYAAVFLDATREVAILSQHHALASSTGRRKLGVAVSWSSTGSGMEVEVETVYLAPDAIGGILGWASVPAPGD
jgi:hypothetical protein